MTKVFLVTPSGSLRKSRDDTTGSMLRFLSKTRLLMLSFFLLIAIVGSLVSAGSPVLNTTAYYLAWNDTGIVYASPSGSAYYPSVIYSANGFGSGTDYSMWYSDGDGSVFRILSVNGISWSQPVKMTGIANAHHVMVIYSSDGFPDAPDAKYRIWYWNISANLYTISSIWTAYSTDGVSWTNTVSLSQDSTAPLVAHTGWNRGTYGPVCVFYNRNASNSGNDPWAYSYTMYYDGTDGSTEQTGLAYSTNGLFWIAYSSDPVLPKSPAPAWDSNDAVYGTVYSDASGYHYWYSGGVSSPNDGIGYAFSPNGMNWTKYAMPVLGISDGFSYRDQRTYTPSIINDGSGRLMMYYSALGSSGGSKKKIGLAILPPPDTTQATPPVAAFSANRTEGDLPFTVKFTDASTNTPTSWSWDFGEGGSSTEQNPVHTFTTSGKYTVKLTATNARGNDVITKTGYITVIAPVVESNSFNVASVNTTMTGSGQNISITTGAGVTTAGNVVTIDNTGSWSSLAITMKDTPENGATTINGTINAVKAVTDPVTAPVGSAGTPTVQISLSMSEMPGTTSSIVQTITKDPDATAQSSFSLFANSQGKQVDDIAYTLNVAKTNLANAGNGGIIQSATLTLTVSKTWVDAHGGIGHIFVLRRADDGTTQILTPAVTGPDGSGYYTVTVISPDGLSTFSVASVSAVSSGSSGSYVDSSSDSGSAPVKSLASTFMLAPVDPDSYPWITQSVNGPTHITRIELQPIGTFKDLFILTEKPDSLPKDMPVPGFPVYELHKIDVYHATSDDINQAVIEFTVSESWLARQKMTFGDVQLLRYHSTEWEKLPTEYVGKKDGEFLYKANAAGFSYFATVLVKDATIVAKSTPTIITTSTATPINDQIAIQRSAQFAPPEPEPTKTLAPVPVSPDTGSPLITIALIGAGCVVLIGSGWGVRRWLIRRQNPALFREYD